MTSGTTDRKKEMGMSSSGSSKLKRVRQVASGVLCLFLCCGTLIAHSWKAPKEESQKQNPISSNRASIDKGREIYIENCGYCHGDNAKGLDSKAAGPERDAPNLIQRLAGHTGGDFHWKIRTGKGEMPSFKDDLSDDEIWHVITYLKHLDQRERKAD